MRRRATWRGLGGALGAAWIALAAWPCAAQTWGDFIASLGPSTPPAAVRDYLARHPLVQSAPKPQFREIRTETVDGSVAQSFRLAGFDGGFGTIEGTREERTQGTRRSGAQTVSMTTALGGLVLVSLDNKTTGATVFLRQIELGGELLPPASGRTLTMKYERIQRAADAIVEELRDCLLTWSEPGVDAPLLESRCTGSTRVTTPKPDGTIAVSTSPDNTNSTFVFRRDLGWLFDQRTRVLDFKP
ncbi:MAG: hypothetical protein HY060_16310 [Proteobacteria bacterium]|nr:hypothetical protein [Pseudomonadota bacterium]